MRVFSIYKFTIATGPPFAYHKNKTNDNKKKKKTQCQELYFHSKKLYPLTIQCYKDVQIIKLIGCCKTENAIITKTEIKKKI